MKVTAGKYKGRTLKNIPYSHLRPTADMVKQAMFNKLQFRLNGSRVLDLFSGTGALGIEALSRGAAEVVFVDKDRRSMQLIQENLHFVTEKPLLLLLPFEEALLQLKGKQFDIILLDPPYREKLYESALHHIAAYDLLAPEGVIVCEREKDEQFDIEPFVCVDEKKYGIKTLTYLEKGRKT